MTQIISTAEDALPTSPQALLQILRDLGIDFKFYEHEAVFTVAESSHIDATIPGTHCRNLFLRDKKKKMFLVVLANETQVNLKQLETTLECGRLSFGSADRLWKHLGVKPGSVCPFAAMNDTDHSVEIILDADMMSADLVNYHPLLNTMTVGLTPKDLLRFFAHTGHIPKIKDLKESA